MLAIAEGRESRNLTQTQLAEATGIHKTDISKLENGTGNPSIKTLKSFDQNIKASCARLNMRLEIKFLANDASNTQ